MKARAHIQAPGMIDHATGEVSFQDGLHIKAHSLLEELLLDLPSSGKWTEALSIPGWKQHLLGEHPSEYGEFSVWLVTGNEDRIAGALVSHCHAFYEPETPGDSERRVFHESILATDLRGQKEFSWGHAFCRVDPKANQDWLVIMYLPYSGVPPEQREAFRTLWAHEPFDQ